MLWNARRAGRKNGLEWSGRRTARKSGSPATGGSCDLAASGTMVSNRRRERREREAGQRGRKRGGGNVAAWKGARAATELVLLRERALERIKLHEAQRTVEGERASARPKPQSESPRGRATCREGDAFPSFGWLRLPRRRRSGKHQPVWRVQRRHRRGCDGCVSTRHGLNWTCGGEALTGCCEASSYRAGSGSERARRPGRGIDSDDERRWT
jgi:hypothetical protein